VVALLAQRTGGNPFFLVELVRSAGVGAGLVDVTAFAETVPRTVRDVIDRRIAALPTQSAPILLAAAVAGRSFDWRVVAAATQQPAAQALDALDAAVVSGLIEEGTTPTRYQLRPRSHPRMPLWRTVRGSAGSTSCGSRSDVARAAPRRPRPRE
jgi:predicted ATPase